MRTFGKTVLAFGLVALSTIPAMAQQGKGQGRGGFGMMGGPTQLLSNKSVQQELKVTDAQAEKLNALAEELQEKQRAEFGKLRDLSAEERREKMQELTRSNNEEVHKSLKGILKEEQTKRFGQIQLQQAGVTAFSTPRVEKELDLTSDQKSKIRLINEDLQESVRGAFGGGGSDFAAAREKITQLRKQGLDKVTALLSDDQKKAWKDLTGEPFEVKFERRPGN
jgi:Spy/CpxP family protein refolding chaperone